MSLRQKEGGVGLFLTWHINSLGRMIIKHCLDDGGWVGDDKMCLKTILGLATAGIEWGPGTRVSIELPTLGEPASESRRERESRGHAWKASSKSKVVPL